MKPVGKSLPFRFYVCSKDSHIIYYPAEIISLMSRLNIR